ncbi:MAG: HlyD family efflux transporter periplasmic adaptor subunit [Myxococcales bacterium]|nr:HlyD family efflux transporter periplasmic adaptor subunit [Myxococcales bacterium]MCB9552766.1 HlyD family efflux transporter periplasmic adaptor subunit [Myxococcales bacterium]
MNARRRILSFALWLVAAGAAFWLWHEQRPEGARLPGLVEAIPMPVGPVEPGRITAIHVVPGQAVRAGDPLVTFDTTVLDAELAIARAELAEALAALDAERTERARLDRRDRLETAARLAEARAQADSAAVERAAVDGELRAINRELERLDPVVEQGVAAYGDLGALTARRERLQGEARHLPEAAAAWKDRTARLESLLQALEAEDPTAPLAPLEAAIRTRNRTIEGLLGRRALAVLRAPRDARVIHVHYGPGAAVPAGLPVVDLLAHDPERLVVWLPESTARRVHIGDRVEIIALDRTTGLTIEGVVEELGPGIIQMPLRLWTHENVPRYGRPAHVRLPQSDLLLADERVLVSVIDDDTPGAALAAEAPTLVAPVVVPAALAARTRVEISGATWLPDRARYLVVSDDTGTPDAGDDTPWVFLVDRDGRMDKDPLAIAGVDAISDLEAITRAPDGAIWLLCSQSLNKKGNRKPKRQWLLRARLTADQLIVDGAVHLFDRLAALPADDRVALGVGDALDLEGMTWHDGALLIGLKAPLDPAGRARIWRLDAPDRLFDRGLGEGGATLAAWAEVSLPTGATRAPGGVSDLFAEGDRLYLTSTLAEGPAAGAAWRLDHREAAPVRLAAWPDRKPEAITRGPDGLRVFFDAGDAPPAWAPLTEGDPR